MLNIKDRLQSLLCMCQVWSTLFSSCMVPRLPIYIARGFLCNKTPAKAFTLPAKMKVGTRPGRAVTREFIGGGIYSLISVLPN